MGTEGRLRGRTALVTGGARRIGRRLVLALAGEGAAVVVHRRTSADEAAELVAGIEDEGGQAWALGGDLADPETAAGLPEAAAGLAGAAPDILVNNASVFASGPLDSATVAEWNLNQDVNLRAPFLVSRSFAAQLPAGRRADIVNLNDYRALRPGADHFAYTISKAGLSGLTRALAAALAPDVRVNELALGAVLTPESPPPDYAPVPRASIPLQRYGSPDEVARALLYLLGTEAVTGQTIFVDGGRHLV